MPTEGLGCFEIFKDSFNPYMNAFVSESHNSEEVSDDKKETENPSPLSGAFGMFSTISSAVQSTVSEIERVMYKMILFL